MADVLAAGGQVQGTIAHDVADGDNPVKVGALAQSAENAAVANNDICDLVCDLVGKLVVLPGSLPEDSLDGNANATGTSNTQIIAAQGAGVRIYVTDIIIDNESATGTAVIIKSATTTRLRYPAPANGGAIHHLAKPLRLTANEALNFASVAAVTTMYVSAVGYKGV